MRAVVLSNNRGLALLAPSPSPKESGPWQSRFEVCGELCPDEYLQRWRQITASRPFAEPFYQPEWFHAGFETHARYKPRYLVSAWEGDNLRGILPLMYDNQISRGIPARVFRSMSWIHSCRFDLIHDGVAPQQSAEYMWKAFLDNKDWDVLEFLDVPSNGALNYLIAAALDDDFHVFVWPTRKSPALNLPNGGDPYAHCPREWRRFRNRIKSKKRKLSEAGDLTFGAELDRPQRSFEEFVRLESKGWKGKNGSSIDSNPTVLHFYHSLMRGFSSKGAFLPYALRLNGRIIAMHFGIYLNGIYYTPKVAYDESYSKFSPGQVLMYEVISDLVDRGARKIDFLGPIAPWKSVWTDEFQAHSSIYIIRPSLYARLACLTPLRCLRGVRSIRDFIWGDPQERRL